MEPITNPSTTHCEFDQFIGIWPNFVNPFLCDQLIDIFEFGLKNNSITYCQGHQIFEKHMGKLGRHDLSMVLNHASEELTHDVHQHIHTCFIRYVEEYNQLSNVRMMSSIVKIQKTEPTGGYHTWHYENSGFYCSDRELVWTIYLNDMPEKEGETEFLYQKKRISPSKGTVIIWPASMTHVHRGLTVYSQNKYISTGWFNKLP